MDPRDEALSHDEIRFNTLLNADLDSMIYLCQADHHFARICHDVYFQEERLLRARIPIHSSYMTLHYHISMIPLLPHLLQDKIPDNLLGLYENDVRNIDTLTDFTLLIHKFNNNRYLISIRMRPINSRENYTSLIGINYPKNVSTGITYQEFIHFLFELYVRRKLKFDIK